MYDSPVIQGSLTEKPWYLFHKEDIDSLLKRIEAAGVHLETICDVFQGVVPGCLSVDKEVLSVLSEKTIQEYGIKEGMGVFVLSKSEVEELNPREKERVILKPYYKNSNVHRYGVDGRNESYLIYTNKSTSIASYPTIMKHLEIFKPRLMLKRETQNGRLPWYSLHWPREEYIFEGKKIICPYRSVRNTFAYSESAFYGSTDMYFIKEKREEKLEGAALDLKYILGILNSNVMHLWTMYKTKPKGEIRELFPTALSEFPIKPIDFEDKQEVTIYNDIIKLVDEIIDRKNKLGKYDELFNPRLSERSEYDKVPECVDDDFIRLLKDEDLRTLETSEALSYEAPSASFELRRVKGIESTAPKDSAFQYQLVIEGRSGEIVGIEGEGWILELLERELGEMRGATRDELADLTIPASRDAFKRVVKESKKQIEALWKEIRELQERIDSSVCGLYGLSLRKVNGVLVEHS